MLAREQAFARRLQQRLVTFSLISREELAYDAKPGSPENPREPRPEAGASLVSEKAVVVRYGPHIAADPVFGDTLPRLPSADEVRHGAPPRRCLPRLHRGGWAMLADGL